MVSWGNAQSGKCLVVELSCQEIIGEMSDRKFSFWGPVSLGTIRSRHYSVGELSEKLTIVTLITRTSKLNKQVEFLQYVIFKLLSYCFEGAIGVRLKA